MCTLGHSTPTQLHASCQVILLTMVIATLTYWSLSHETMFTKGLDDTFKFEVFNNPFALTTTHACRLS